MIGWNRVTGVPTAGKPYELDVGWAVEHLPAWQLNETLARYGPCAPRPRHTTNTG